MARQKFIRQDYMRHPRIGKLRRKLQKWRKPKGRHSKMREYRKSYPVSPSVGYGSPRKEIGKISGKTPILVHNMNDLSKLKQEHLAIISSKVGARKRLDIIKKAQEMKIQIYTPERTMGVKK